MNDPGYEVKSTDTNKIIGVRHPRCMDESVVKVKQKPNVGKKHGPGGIAAKPGIDLHTCEKCGKPVSDILLSSAKGGYGAC